MVLQLTNEQSKPVNSNCKINVVLSVPGSGKTTVLIARAERLWNETREPTLIVTFSSDACNNILKRIAPEVKLSTDVKTIHSFCFDVVKNYWRELGEICGGEYWPLEPKLISKEQEIEVISDLFKEDNALDIYERFFYLRSLATNPEQLLRLFKKKVYFDRIRSSDIEKFIVFEKSRLSRGLINFDDMIDLAEVLIPLPYVSTDLSRRYSHLLIDEAQDTSDQQWKILRPLVLNASSSLVVGDVNQAVYGWRNADGSILFNMSSMKEAVTFRLAQSFRSGANITDLANQICYDKNSQIVSQNPLGEVTVRKFKSVEDEVRWVLTNVCKNSAIISRTNSYLEKFERACIENNVCYLGKSFYRSNHINDLYQFFSDYTGTDTLAILDKAFISNASYSRHQSDDFKLVGGIIRKEGLSKFIDLVNTSRLLEDAGVTLTTGHSSKGLEWDRVFVIGCHTGHVPHKSANDDREERNLLYVMTSRAAKELIITCIDEPSIYLPSDVRKNAIES